MQLLLKLLEDIATSLEQLCAFKVEEDKNRKEIVKLVQGEMEKKICIWREVR